MGVGRWASGLGHLLQLPCRIRCLLIVSGLRRPKRLHFLPEDLDFLLRGRRRRGRLTTSRGMLSRGSAARVPRLHPRRLQLLRSRLELSPRLLDLELSCLERHM